MTLLLLAWAIFLPFVAPTFPADDMLPATVVRVSDGDTIRVRLDDCPLEYVRVRYIGVDTPERGECYWAEARDRNAELVTGQRVDWAPSRPGFRTYPDTTSDDSTPARADPVSGSLYCLRR